MSGNLGRQLVEPLQHFGSETIIIHPIHEEGEIERIARGKWFYFFQQSFEFFLVELAIKVQAEQVIGESDLLRHLELLGQRVGRVEITALHRVIQQCAQCAGAERSEFAEPLEVGARSGALFLVGRTDLQCGKIKLVKIVARLFFNRGRELLLLLGKISLCAREPAGDNMESSSVTVVGGHMVERFSRDVELAKSQGRGREV